MPEPGCQFPLLGVSRWPMPGTGCSQPRSLPLLPWRLEVSSPGFATLTRMDSVPSLCYHSLPKQTLSQEPHYRLTLELQVCLGKQVFAFCLRRQNLQNHPNRGRLCRGARQPKGMGKMFICSMSLRQNIHRVPVPHCWPLYTRPPWHLK